MGFLAPAEQAAEVLTVATAMGKAALRPGPDAQATGSWPKARVFVLEDRTVVLVTPGPGPRTVERQTYLAEASDWNRTTSQLSVVLSDGAVLTVDAKGCGCNMGVVGSAGPTAEAYRLTKVRAPEWHTVST